ncbi:hypothetical protein CDAR_605481 [Caerostris darwini]|uniref:Uncharacterized protein n=1 Tax=Caerostris darwini TaxID=1538125 RepID=A0AAV4RDI5_9ARAC|nr:hypothetical protein CDAR_605481 [Caerostris darwini]
MAVHRVSEINPSSTHFVHYGDRWLFHSWRGQMRFPEFQGGTRKSSPPSLSLVDAPINQSNNLTVRGYYALIKYLTATITADEGWLSAAPCWNKT